MKKTAKGSWRLYRETPLGKMKDRTCNLCFGRFRSRTIFDRYCPGCREHNDLLRFSEWLPETDPPIGFWKKLVA